MEALRMEAEAGIASNSTLLTLVMYYLIEQNGDKARPYFDQLKEHEGSAPLIQRIEKAFPPP
jgi:hypothetical protein